MFTAANSSHMSWVRSSFCYKTGHALVYIISHSLASSRPRPEFRGLQCTYKSRSFPTSSDEFTSRRIRPLCLWGQWSNSRPAANTVQQVPSPLLMQALNKTKNHHTSVQPMRCAACLALKWNISKQKGFDYMKEHDISFSASQDTAKIKQYNMKGQISGMFTSFL